LEYEISGWEGYYLYITDNDIKVLSSCGFCKGKPSKGDSGPTEIIPGKRKELTLRKNTYGYMTVDLGGQKRKKTRQLHRLIAETLISNTNNFECVDHIDGNKLNNHPSNLQWITRGDNVIKAQSMGKWGTPPQSYKIVYESGNTEIITNISDFSRKNNYYATKLVAISKGKRKTHKNIVNVIKLEN
jgi:hypothetical protein